MNSRLLNTIVLLGLVASIACTSSTMQALEDIKAKQFANDFVGQQIVDTILLQAQAGGPADVVVRLLNGLILNLRAQQKKHNQEHTANNVFWRSQLRKYVAVVRSLKAQIARLQTRILAVSKRIRQNRYNIKINEAQQRLIQQKKADLKAARNIDRQAYIRRHARQVELLKAVNYIIAQLQLALKAKNFVQLDQIKEQLTKLTKENPLEALVQLTMTFNPSSVNYAITKLGDIRVGLEASLKDDSSHEVAALKQYKDLNIQFRAFLRNVAAQLQKQRALLARQRSLRRQLRKALAEAQALLKTYRALIAALRATRRAYNIHWRQSRASRISQAKTIKIVIGIIQVNAPQVNTAAALAKRLTSRK